MAAIFELPETLLIQLKLIRRTVQILLLFSFAGCIFDSGTDNVVDDYKVTWIDPA
jgi:hypothetical protein